LRRPFIVTSAITIVLLCHPSASSADTFVHRYSIRLAGLPVGSAVLDASIMPERYAAKVRANIGWLGIGYRVEGESAGRRSGPTLTPEAFRMVFPGRTSTTITMRFVGQSVADYAMTPPIAADEIKKRVPITADQLKGVTDPLSALISASLVMNRDPDRLCRGSTGVFVGFTRFDLQLEPKVPEVAKGAAPNSVICRVLYRPVAGHRSDELVQVRLAASPDIEVSFQWSEKEGVWAVSRITLPTPLGTVVIQRRRE
jgi:hypothetical protein